VFGTVAIVALYFAAWKLVGSWWGALVAALVFAASPAFGPWAVTIFNNVPVLALELCALAVVLWAPRERSWRFAAAGALLSLAFFARITELVYVAPLALLVVWRTRALRPLLAFAGASLAGVALIAITNKIFYGDPLFLPYVGNGYIPFVVGMQPDSSRVLLGHYAPFFTDVGRGEPVSNFNLLDQLNTVWFHVRYLASSTFAFPFLPLAYVGLTWRAVAGKRDIWVLVGAILTVTLAILAIYGHRSNHYFGFGQPIVRSSFIRYSLPIYALLAVAAGAFFLDARRVFRGAVAAAVMPIALIVIVVTVGVAHSYDGGVYGFNRLNGYREGDRAAWSKIRPLLEAEQTTPLLIGGEGAAKLLDTKYERFFIDYVSNGETIPVAQQAAKERSVYVITSDSDPQDNQLQTTLYTLYRPQMLLHAGEFRVHQLLLDPAKYVLSYVDVWNTSGAFDRWSTADGYLESNAANNYVQLVPVDVDGDGLLDHDVTLEIELWDSGPDEFTISGLDSREGSRPPVPLVRGPLNQTGTWRTVTFSLRTGEHLRSQLDVSPGLTISSIKVVAMGTK
jgi:hypothetical protein